MDYQMLYVRSRKNWKGRKENFLFILPSAKKIHSVNKQACRVYFFDTRQTISLPSVFFWHSANKLFAECLYFAECILGSTRQISGLPSARKTTLGNFR